jgi:hypothetical protein
MAPQEYEDLVRRLTALVVKLDERVAYLLAADNVSRPLLCRLREVNQPVMSPQNRFSGPHAARLS